MCHMARSRIQEYTYQLQFCCVIGWNSKSNCSFLLFVRGCFQYLIYLFFLWYLTWMGKQDKCSQHKTGYHCPTCCVVYASVWTCRLFGFCFNMKSITLAYSHWWPDWLDKFLRLSPVIVDRSDLIAVSFAGSPGIVLPLLRMLFVIDDKIFWSVSVVTRMHPLIVYVVFVNMQNFLSYCMYLYLWHLCHTSWIMYASDYRSIRKATNRCFFCATL